MIPAGNGILTTLTVIGDNPCLSDEVASSLGGTTSSDIVNCTTLLVEGGYIGDMGCTDSNACNYNPDAIEDDGSCAYAEENFDCNGNCIVDIDECGICGGDGLSCQESTVDIYYDSAVDIAGFQFNVNSSTLVSAAGGAAESAGFTVSTSSETGVVLGFSFS